MPTVQPTQVTLADGTIVTITGSTASIPQQPQIIDKAKLLAQQQFLNSQLNQVQTQLARVNTIIAALP